MQASIRHKTSSKSLSRSPTSRPFAVQFLQIKSKQYNEASRTSTHDLDNRLGLSQGRHRRHLGFEQKCRVPNDAALHESQKD
jgi:hypothetical protein